SERWRPTSSTCSWPHMHAMSGICPHSSRRRPCSGRDSTNSGDIARGAMRMTEHDEQVQRIRWAGLARGAYPALRWLHAVPNGGARNIVVARKLKAEGVQRGVPDLCLPVPRGPYHGLYIELKR